MAAKGVVIAILSACRPSSVHWSINEPKSGAATRDQMKNHKATSNDQQYQDLGREIANKRQRLRYALRKNPREMGKGTTSYRDQAEAFGENIQRRYESGYGWLRRYTI